MLRVRTKKRLFGLLLPLLLVMGWPIPGRLDAASDVLQETAADTSLQNNSTSRVDRIGSGWSGHLKLRGTASWNDPDSIFAPVGAGTFYDAAPEIRVKHEAILSERVSFEAHYEAVLLAGDSIRNGNWLKSMFPEIFSDDNLLLDQAVDDDRRFMDLTAVIAEGDDYTLYHRLDRLNLTYEPDWGTIRIGRQAVTWGNGLLFGPMDLFNPFSPIDVEADYKIGDDMIFVNVPWEKSGDFQCLVLPRRGSSGDGVEWESSSLAGKFHFSPGKTGLDVMAAHHHEDDIIGLGIAQTIGKAVLRVDATWTFLDAESTNDDYLSLIANMDFEWTLWNRYVYGMIEYYHNGLGKGDPADAFMDPHVLARIDRGELFVLGKDYLSAGLQVEIHPGINTFFIIIDRLGDTSGIVLPWITWDVTQEVKATLGGNVSYGGDGTEFGGFRAEGLPSVIKLPDSLYFYLTYLF